MTMTTIAIEEHFSLLPEPWGTPSAAKLERLRSGKQHDPIAEVGHIGESRIACMDTAGITMQVVSCCDLQQMEAPGAVRQAQVTNDTAYDAVTKYPDRFAAFAALPTHDPAASVTELERAITKLGFKGALIAGHTRGEYLDDKRFWPIFECAEALDVPIYLHPASPHPLVQEAYFADYPDLTTAAWGYGIETGTHFLRLVFSGVFDAFPGLKMILGHLGEGLPFWLDRTDAHTGFDVARRGLKKRYRDYVRDHLWVTCSGNFSQPAFLCTMLALGIEKMMFAVDWPLEDAPEAVAFLKSLPISDADKERVAHGNAEALLKLPN